jgi:hypothetical protein
MNEALEIGFMNHGGSASMLAIQGTRSLPFEL